MSAIGRFGISLVVCLSFVSLRTPPSQSSDDIPPLLEPWQSWAVRNEPHINCPPLFNDAKTPICFWPSQLRLAVDANGATWRLDVQVFDDAWVPLPGNQSIWPTDVATSNQKLPVLTHNDHPSVQLAPGQHQLTGRFHWERMPLRLAIPAEIGVLRLDLEGANIPVPKRDPSGDVWLRRVQEEDVSKDQLTVQVYRLIEDGIPMWLRTEIELTVSGKSREESLGFAIPEGWTLSSVESHLPVAVDESGQLKVQVRSGKWSITLNAFRTDREADLHFAAGTTPILSDELVGFVPDQTLRVVEIQGATPIDAGQTTYPQKWRHAALYGWTVATPLQVVEKMRGIGTRKAAGLSINRQIWIDDDGRAATYHDKITGAMHTNWRLDVADDHELGSVRVDGESQLITANPRTQTAGVELRTRNLQLDAVGRTTQIDQIPATGWRADAESLSLTFHLPPGWRVFAIFGPDRVRGEWLSKWTLFDLFLLLVFAIAVLRLWGILPGIIALFAFALIYHEPGAPRFTWFFLLIPTALEPFVRPGKGLETIRWLQRAALLMLVLVLIPFVTDQVQSVLYPQLGFQGYPYSSRFIMRSGHIASSRVGRNVVEESDSAGAPQFDLALNSNMKQIARARIQTGPAEPRWRFVKVDCQWEGPVTGEQVVRPIFISRTTSRIITVVRVLLMFALLAILLRTRPRKARNIPATAVPAILVSLLLGFPSQTEAQYPDPILLEQLRERLLKTSSAFPHAAEISTTQMAIVDNRVTLTAEIHAATDVAVPIPGELPSWSPLRITLDGEAAPAVCRRERFLWVAVPKGIHTVTVEGLLSDSLSQWEWTFLLKPHRLTIDAPSWAITGLSPDGIPGPQIILVKEQQTSGEAAYDQDYFQPIALVERRLEIGIVWKVRTDVKRLSKPGRAISLNIPLLNGERVLTSGRPIENGLIDVQLGSNESTTSWESELPTSDQIDFTASASGEWVEQWHLAVSPSWNIQLEGISPTFSDTEPFLTPIWHPWPGESVSVTFSQPETIPGPTTTIHEVTHRISLGKRQRTSELLLEVASSLASDLPIALPSEAEIVSLKVNDREVPARIVSGQLMVPTRPGNQSVSLNWTTRELLETVTRAAAIGLPTDVANVTTEINVTTARWVLWANGPLQGPAVRMWTVLLLAVIIALVLSSVPLSPLKRYEWLLLALGLTQIHPAASLVVVGWLFVLAWRGTIDPDSFAPYAFNLLQLFIIAATFAALGIFLVIVGMGLLGTPDMFITGNQSTYRSLRWFLPRSGGDLPEPSVVSVSVWYYRLLMLLWALWLANALIRWLGWGWQQYAHEGVWRKNRWLVPPPATKAPSDDRRESSASPPPRPDAAD